MTAWLLLILVVVASFLMLATWGVIAFASLGLL